MSSSCLLLILICHPTFKGEQRRFISKDIPIETVSMQKIGLKKVENLCGLCLNVSLLYLLSLSVLPQQRKGLLLSAPRATAVLFSISRLCAQVGGKSHTRLSPLQGLLAVAACGQRSTDNPFTTPRLWALYITSQSC